MAKLLKWHDRPERGGMTAEQFLDMAHEMEMEKPAFFGSDMRKFKRIQRRWLRGFKANEKVYYLGEDS